jgi:hypothetical protein
MGLVATTNLSQGPTMTDAMKSLKDLIEKTPDGDILRDMIGFAVIGAIKLTR